MKGRGVARRALAAVVVVSHLSARSTSSTATRVAEGYVVREATGADLARLAADLGHEITPRKVALIHERAGDQRFAVFVASTLSGEICGFGQIEFGRIRDEHLSLHLGAAPEVAHLIDDYVGVRHRGHRLQTALVTARIQHAHARGSSIMTVLVEASNRASRASMGRAGFRPAFRVFTLRTPWWKRSWALCRDPRARITHTAGSPGQYPETPPTT